MAEVTFTGAGARAGTESPVPIVHFRLVQTGAQPDLVYQWGIQSLADAFGMGMIEGRVLDIAPVERALSDWLGQHETQTFDFEIADDDLTIGTLLENATAQYLLNRLVTVYLHEDNQRRTGSTARVIVRGVLRSYDRDDYRVTFTAEDWLTSSFGPFNTLTKIPKRTISYAIFADAPYYVFGLAEPIIYGAISDEGGSPTGLVPVIPVGTEDISGTTWKRFLIASHACKAVLNLYQNGAVMNYGTDVLCPGKAGWPFGTAYRDINGRRYTLIYAKGTPGDTAADGSAPIFANVQGIETVGDGSGTLITDLLVAYRHFLVNWALQDYQTGLWLAVPNWPNSNPAVPALDSASFDAASTTMGVRLGGGYVGGGIINEQAELREWMARWDNSCDVNHGFLRTGSLFVTADDSSTPTSTYEEALDIIDGSFKTPIAWDLHATTIPYSYCYDYLGKRWIYEGVELYSQTAIDNWKFERKSQPIEMYFVRTAPVSESIAANRLRRYCNPPRRVIFDTGLHGTNLELGAIIGVTSREGTGANGWTNRPVRVERIKPSLKEMKVYVEGIDKGAQAVLTYAVRAGNQRVAGGYVPPTANGYPPSGGGGVTTYNLGGDRFSTIDSPGPGWVTHPNAIPVVINAALFPNRSSVKVRCYVRALNVGVTVTPGLQNLTTAASAGAGAPVTSTDWVFREFDVTLANGINTYAFQLLPGSANEPVYGHAYLEIV